jgi:hypothetical protein
MRIQLLLVVVVLLLLQQTRVAGVMQPGPRQYLSCCRWWFLLFFMFAPLWMYVGQRAALFCGTPMHVGGRPSPEGICAEAGFCWLVLSAECPCLLLVGFV